MAIKTLQKLAVPDEKNCIFVSPEYAQWQSLLGRNRRSLGNFPEAYTYRDQLLSTALNYTKQIGLSAPHEKEYKNIIVTGHQPLWHHCGILAKNIIIDRFARETNGVAVHLILDHDICNTSIILPDSDGAGFLQLKTIQLEQLEQNIPLELRSLPGKVISFIGSFSNNSFCSGIWRQYSKQILNDIGSLRNIADIITLLQAILNQALGLEIIYLPVSLMAESDCFTSFASSIICDAVNFAESYSHAICDQIRTYNLNPVQTIRPLEINLQQNLVELPFWLTFPTGQKFSLRVNFGSKNLKFGIATKSLGTLDSSTIESKKQQFLEVLKTHNCRIRPKAVSLTLFTRLYIADWFVHGIGGGLYEYITDYIINKYYRIMKLNFGVATATMTLPLETNSQNSYLTEAQSKSRLRELKFNPEKFIEHSILDRPLIISLLNTKNELIKTARNPQLPAAERKAAWLKLANINKELLEYTEHKYETLLKKTGLREKIKLSEEVINYREFFFGLFPEQRLKNLANLKEVESGNSLNCCPSSR